MSFAARNRRPKHQESSSNKERQSDSFNGNLKRWLGPSLISEEKPVSLHTGSTIKEGSSKEETMTKLVLDKPRGKQKPNSQQISELLDDTDQLLSRSGRWRQDHGERVQRLVEQVSALLKAWPRFDDKTLALIFANGLASIEYGRAFRKKWVQLLPRLEKCRRTLLAEYNRMAKDARNEYLSREPHVQPAHVLKRVEMYLEARRASSLGGLETRSGSKRPKPSNSHEGEIVWRMWSELESVDVQKARIDTRSMDAKRTSNDFKLARILSSLVSCVGWNIGARAILQMLRRHSRHH